MELVVDLLVHGGGDDADFREGVGHRVDAHLRHQQGQEEDFILCYIVVLYAERQSTILNLDKKCQQVNLKLYFSITMVTSETNDE